MELYLTGERCRVEEKDAVRGGRGKEGKNCEEGKKALTVDLGKLRFVSSSLSAEDDFPDHGGLRRSANPRTLNEVDVHERK